MTALRRSHRRALTAVFVIVLVVLSGMLRPRVQAIEAKAERNDVLHDAKARGLTDEQASCVASDVDSFDGGRKTLTLLFECLGMDVGTDECVVDAVSEIMNLERADADDFVDAEAALDAEDRERIAEAGMRCRGVSAEVAACVTDAMRDEFGDDLFESRSGPKISAEGQRQVAAMADTCAGASGSSDEVAIPVAGPACDAYARSISDAWSAVAPRRFVPSATASAVATALERSAPDAPGELADDVAAVVAAARRNAEEVVETHGNAMTEEAALAAFRVASLEGDAQMRIWAACPDLDAHLGDRGVDFAAMVFAIGGSQADMEEELSACIRASGASKPGDDPGCDRLVSACTSGGLEACDDIFVWSAEGSTYEEIGAGCGGRLESDDELYGRGACDSVGR